MSIFFVRNYIFLLLNERLLKLLLICNSLKMAEINFFHRYDKGLVYAMNCVICESLLRSLELFGLFITELCSTETV